MNQPLSPLSSQLVDGENNAIRTDIAFQVRGDNFLPTLKSIQQKYVDNFYLVPVSGGSAGGGVFQKKCPPGGTVIGIQFAPATQPKISNTKDSQTIALTDISLDQIIIDKTNHLIYAGSAITLDQLNIALGETLGSSYRVLGADLTSYTYAQVGATFMTGGMGPQRRYFSDSVDAVALYNGSKVVEITNDKVSAYAGTYGWTGLVCAVCCRFVKLPANEIAFAIPVSNQPEDIARLLQHFSSLSYLQVKNHRVMSNAYKHAIILGLEHVTTNALEPLFAFSADQTIIGRAKQLAEKCRLANADGLIFINGMSDLSEEDFLVSLVDDEESDHYTIAGIDLSHTEIFKNADQMRALREAVPFAARTQSPVGEFVFKGHTDANIHIHPDNVAESTKRLWQANLEYIESIRQYYATNPDVRGEVLVYGHMNPNGMDPHNRLTFACDDAEQYRQAVNFVEDQRDQFLQKLRGICDETGSVFVGGEKGAGSEQEMLNALGGVEGAPPHLSKKITAQQEIIGSALPMFNWRAPKSYLSL